MNLKINILTKKRVTNLDIYFLVIIIFRKTQKQLMAVAEEATEIFL